MNKPDEFHGIGGSYVIDPATGKRTLVSRTNTSAPTVESPETGAGPVSGVTATPDASAPAKVAAKPQKSPASKGR